MPDLVIAPSILAADFSRLGEEIRRVEAGGADWIHVDVMDGHFVPNLTMGPDVLRGIRKSTRLPLDVHLMVENPEGLVKEFADAGADRLTFHVEALVPESRRRRVPRGWTIDEGAYDPGEVRVRAEALAGTIRGLGKGVGIALNPDTAAEAVLPFAARADLVLAMTVWPGFGGQSLIPAVLPKIAAIRKAAPGIRIEVDGGLYPDTVGAATAAGADTVVAGTAVFRSPDAGKSIRDLREAANRSKFQVPSSK